MNLEKRKKACTTGLDDFPVEILVCILSCLTLKVAVRTSVLSTRWRYLWRFTSGTLDFNYLDARSWIVKAEFIRCMNQIMKLHQSPSIDKLFVSFPPPRDMNPWAVEHCISFALHKDVKILHIDLSNIKSFPLGRNVFLSTTMSQLTCVQLVYVNVTDDLIEHIVSHAPWIETISIKMSFLLKNLVVVGSTTLKYLKVEYCHYLKSLKVVCPSLLFLKIMTISHLKSMEVRAVNLVSLEYIGDDFRQGFKDVRPLSELRLGGYYCNIIVRQTDKLRKNYSWLKRLKKLSMDVSRKCTDGLWNVRSSSLEPTPFLNLEQLDLDILLCAGDDLGFIHSLVARCPILSGLVIKLMYRHWPEKDELIYRHRPEKNDDDKECCKRVEYEHRCLKFVKIIEFAGLSTDFDLALWFLIFGKLDKMVIRLNAHPAGKDMSLSKARTEAMRLLKYLPRKTKLVLL